MKQPKESKEIILTPYDNVFMRKNPFPKRLQTKSNVESTQHSKIEEHKSYSFVRGGRIHAMIQSLNYTTI